MFDMDLGWRETLGVSPPLALLGLARRGCPHGIDGRPRHILTVLFNSCEGILEFPGG